jgi:hypothetical protein
MKTNTVKLLTLVFVLLAVSQTFAQVDAVPAKNNFKIRVPLKYNGFFSQRFSAGLQYERLISATNTLSLGAMYYHHDNQQFSYSGGIVPYRVLMILPQWRHYFRKNKEHYFNGFHIGVSSAYLNTHIDWSEATEKKHYAGIGGLIGYQQVIKKRLAIGCTPSLHYGFEATNLAGYNRIGRRMATAFSASVDVHIGYIF